MSNRKVGIFLMLIGGIITIFSLTLRMQKYICCSSFAGTKLGSAIDVWLNNYQQRYQGACICNDTAGAIPNFYYIPLEFIILGIIIFFVGLIIYRRRS